MNDFAPLRDPKDNECDLSDADFLRSIANRLFCLGPALTDTDQAHCERLAEIAERIDVRTTKYRIVPISLGGTGVQRENGDVAGFTSEENAKNALKRIENGTTKEWDFIWKDWGHA